MIGVALCAALWSCSSGDDGGICYSDGADVDECFSSNTDECQEWDDGHINGGDWTYSTDKTCKSLGFTKECGGAYVRKDAHCAY